MLSTAIQANSFINLHIEASKNCRLREIEYLDLLVASMARTLDYAKLETPTLYTNESQLLQWAHWISSLDIRGLSIDQMHNEVGVANPSESDIKHIKSAYLKFDKIQTEFSGLDTDNMPLVWAKDVLKEHPSILTSIYRNIDLSKITTPLRLIYTESIKDFLRYRRVSQASKGVSLAPKEPPRNVIADVVLSCILMLVDKEFDLEFLINKAENNIAKYGKSMTPDEGCPPSLFMTVFQDWRSNSTSSLLTPAKKKEYLTQIASMLPISVDSQTGTTLLTHVLRVRHLLGIPQENQWCSNINY